MKTHRPIATLPYRIAGPALAAPTHRLAALLLVLVTLGTAPVAAQTFEGRVLGASGEGPVGTALVRLVDESGEQRAISISDANGFYRLRAPEPGVYRIDAERIGYTKVESPLFEALRPDGVYPIDLEMAAAPVELLGLTVETDRLSEERADHTVRMITGLHPKSLRFRPVGYETLQNHLARAHTLTDVVRWEFAPAVLVRDTRDGPCFEYRSNSCLPVYLNSLRLDADFMTDLPLDMLFRVQVITPTDGSVIYPGGAVLLYTEAWLR